MPTTPEDRARESIDRFLDGAGWTPFTSSTPALLNTFARTIASLLDKLLSRFRRRALWRKGCQRDLSDGSHRCELIAEKERTR